MERIELYLSNGTWFAKSDSALTYSLFGTDTLPTAYTARTSANDVLRNISRLNPDALVIMLEQLPYEEETPKQADRIGATYQRHNLPDVEGWKL